MEVVETDDYKGVMYVTDMKEGTGVLTSVLSVKNAKDTKSLIISVMYADTEGAGVIAKNASVAYELMQYLINNVTVK